MLFKMAISKEEYMNKSTLESRIASLIKGKQLNNHNKRHANYSSVGRMVPTTTTGLSNTGGNPSSMVTSSACASSVGLAPSRRNHDVLELREYMRTLVYSELHKHHPCPDDDASKAKYLHVARRLEEGLFEMANTREDYLNPSTLTSRLASLIRGKKIE
ncbi:Histone acetyltransferase HAC1 [Raphanus sativus]|nr:Histone acetyltransferase HAC1 [Raphanus sativus]